MNKKYLCHELLIVYLYVPKKYYIGNYNFTTSHQVFGINN